MTDPAHPRRLLTLDEPTLRGQRRSKKWRAYDPDVLPLWVAEMDVLPAPPAAAELRRVAEEGDLGYPVAEPYLESVAGMYRRSWGAEVDPGAARLVADVMAGVRESLLLLTEPGDPVLITAPVYPPFHAVVPAIGRQLVTVPLTPTGRLDAAAIEAALAGLGGRRAAILLASPHNPTGAVHTADELRAVLAVADAHGAGVVCDEIHAPLVLPGATFTPMLALPEAAQVLTVVSPAKGWNLAGLKAAAVLPGPGAHDVVARMPPEAGFAASHVATLVHAAAMDEGGPWLADLIADLDANRTLLGELLSEHLPQVRWQPMEATYLAWLDVSALGLDGDRILAEARVALNDGPTFGPGGEDHVRMNLATSPAIITEAVRRIAAICG